MRPRSVAVDNAAKSDDGEKVRELREDLFITQGELAFHSQVDSGRLSKFEHGIGYLSGEQRKRVEGYLRAEAVRRHQRLGKLVAAWGASTQSDRAPSSE